MTRARSDNVTLPQALVLAVCLGAVGWLFFTVVQTYGGYSQLPDMQTRLNSLEQRCGHGR